MGWIDALFGEEDRKEVLRWARLIANPEMRKQITHDQDCTVAGTRLLARRDLAVMIEGFTALGGAVPLPTVDERLKENYRPISKGRIVKLPPPTKGRVLGGRSW